MRWTVSLSLLAVCCTLALGPGHRVWAASADDAEETGAPLVREPMPLSPDMPPLTGEPIRPLPKRTAPAKPTAPWATKPIPVPPPAPHFDPTAPPALTLTYPGPDGFVNEGAQTLVWNTGGPITQVKLTYRGERCHLGGASRGTFSGTVGKMTNQGLTRWAVPWMDATAFTLRLVGYGADGKELAAVERKYLFRPKVLLDKPDTCIVVSKARQRLYYLRDGVVRRMHIISTAMAGYNTPDMRPGSYGSRGEMGRVFSKDYAPVSSWYHVTMYYWLGITSSGSHGIHATYPNCYYQLGEPASHGCIRQHRADAVILYDLVSVGTAVYVQ